MKFKRSKLSYYCAGLVILNAIIAEVTCFLDKERAWRYALTGMAVSIAGFVFAEEAAMNKELALLWKHGVGDVTRFLKEEVVMLTNANTEAISHLITEVRELKLPKNGGDPVSARRKENAISSKDEVS